MLTYRLTSTTGDIGVDHDEHGKSEPNHTGTATLERHRIFAHHGAPRRRRRVADLQVQCQTGPYRRPPTPLVEPGLVSNLVSLSPSPLVSTNRSGVPWRHARGRRCHPRPRDLGQFVARRDSAWYRVSVGTALLMGLGHQQV